MRRTIGLLLALLSVWFAIPTSAGEIGLTWSPSPGATGYRVYMGTDPADMQKQGGDVTETEAVIGGLPDSCTLNHVHVTAFNPVGESGPSETVQFYTRPIVLSVDTSASPWTVSGGNFESGVTVTVGGTVVQSTRVDCETLTVPVVASDIVQANPVLTISTNGGATSVSWPLVPKPPSGLGVQ